MILRSASTPVLSSLLPTQAESPVHSGRFNSPKHSTLTSPKKCPQKKRVSFQPTVLLTPITCTSSSTIATCPSFKTELPSSASNGKSNSRIQRAQSEGNLDGLLSSACKSFDEFTCPIPTKKFPPKSDPPVLQPVPVFNEDGQSEDDEMEEVERTKRDKLERLKVESRKVEDGYLNLERANVKSKGSGNIAEMENESVPSKMHLARGLGATIPGGFDDGKCGGGRASDKRKGFGRDGSGGTDVKEHYKRMVEENPGNPLFLSNYAQFLHQSNDLGGAEEYYARAILTDASDSQILSSYAQVIWEIHHDEERASSYYQRALQAAPTDSQVLAGYASFLWETQQTDNCKNATLNALVSGKMGLQILI